MAAVTPSLRSALLFVGVFVFASAEKIYITAEPGDIILPCRAPNSNIRVVEWSRADLKGQFVVLYRNGLFDPDLQHPSFKNRVELKDTQMKDGDVSVILKNVTINDTGTYECRVFMEETRSWELSIINLRVVPSGPAGGTTEDGGSVGLIVGLIIPALLLVAVVAVRFRIYIKHKPHEGSCMPTEHKLGPPLLSEQNCESDDVKKRRPI